MPDILVVGSLAYDEVQTPFERRKDVLGGAASYFSVAASLYSPVHVVGVVGDDFDQADVDRLGRRGVDVSGVERRPGRSFRWFGRYDYDMSTAETLNTDLGVFRDWRPDVPEALRGAPFVFLANIHPDIQLDVLRQMRKPTLVAMDSMNYWLEHSREAVGEVMSRVDVVSINEAEARQFAQTFSIIRAARAILALGPRALVVKRGEHGATLFLRGGGAFWTPAYPLEKVQDPTGAGDAFAGGLLGHLSVTGRCDDDELRRAVVHGVVCGSFAVEAFSIEGLEGATREGVARRFAELREIVALGAEGAAPDAPVPARKGTAGRPGL